jgi:predicted phage-related endonuclease
MDCPDRCDDTCDTCGRAITEETTDLTVFQSKALSTMRQIAELDIQKKRLDAQDKAVRKQLQELMDAYSIKCFENDILKVTYVEPTTRTTIDSTRLKKDYPDIAEQYSKTTNVSGSVRITVK